MNVPKEANPSKTSNQPAQRAREPKPVHKRERNMNIQTWLDLRMFADLVLEFDRQGIPHHGRASGIVRRILHAAHQEWNCGFFDSIEDALEYLESEGFPLNQFTAGRSRPKVLRSMNAESLKAVTEDPQKPEPDSDLDSGRPNEIAQWLEEAQTDEAPE